MNLKMHNIYKLHYQLDEIADKLQPVIDFINTRIDSSNPGSLIEVRETARMLLNTASRCHLSADYYHKRLGKRAGEEYALYSSLREYTEMTCKNLESTIMSISNTINYYKHER